MDTERFFFFFFLLRRLEMLGSFTEHVSSTSVSLGSLPVPKVGSFPIAQHLQQGPWERVCPSGK